MKLSLSVRVAEKFAAKREPALGLAELADMAVASGYRAVCMRASQLGVHTPRETVAAAAALLRARGLAVSMVTGDFAIPENTEDGVAALRDIAPYLDLAETLGSDLLRVSIKTEADIVWAQRSADAARERGMRLAHQCHTRSLFETVDGCLDALRRIDRSNFGLVYEPANLELCGQPYGRETLRRFAPHLFNVYLQNHRLDPDGGAKLTTWCRGDVRFDLIHVDEPGGIDFPAIVSGLRELGYSGYLTVHQAALETPAAVASRSARYLLELAGQAHGRVPHASPWRNIQ